MDSVMDTMDAALNEGAENLLLNCAGMKSGESLVILHEDPALGWYDRAAPEAIAACARRMGMKPTLIQVNAPGRNEPLAETIETAMAEHDQTIFFARLGDQDRFAPARTSRPAVMSYVTDAALLATRFGRTDHKAMVELKDMLNKIMDRAEEIHVTCPSGTDLKGRLLPGGDDGPEDVSISRYPMGVYKPIPMSGFSGRVAVTRYVTPTGSRPYEPAVLTLEGTVFAHVDKGRITGFEGPEAERVEAHYRHVADLFGIAPMIADSWHSGMHPACDFQGRASDDVDKWGNTVFCNPRVLHCHTCGDYAPGEICWMVFDPVIRIDGAVLWDKGRMNVRQCPELTEFSRKWPEIGQMLENPATGIGLD